MPYPKLRCKLQQTVCRPQNTGVICPCTTWCKAQPRAIAQNCKTQDRMICCVAWNHQRIATPAASQSCCLPAYLAMLQHEPGRVLYRAEAGTVKYPHHPHSCRRQHPPHSHTAATVTADSSIEPCRVTACATSTRSPLQPRAWPAEADPAPTWPPAFHHQLT